MNIDPKKLAAALRSRSYPTPFQQQIGTPIGMMPISQEDIIADKVAERVLNSMAAALEGLTE